VVASLASRSAPELVAALKQRGVLASAMDASTLRLVTHHDVTRADCENAARALEQVLE
jgi:threonine aldolase